MSRKIEKASRLLDEICAAYGKKSDERARQVENERQHARTVLSWVRRLARTTTLPLELAALFHDVDRIVNVSKRIGFGGNRRSRAYLDYKKQHARRSEIFIGPRLVQMGFPGSITDRTRFLIRHHDDPGKEVEQFRDSELNILVTADTCAFFTSIAPRMYKQEGKSRIRDKVRFMVGKTPVEGLVKLWNVKLRDRALEELKTEVLLEYFLKQSQRRSGYIFCPYCARQLKHCHLAGRQFERCVKCGFVSDGGQQRFPVQSAHGLLERLESFG